jgi:hypothetical protein
VVEVVVVSASVVSVVVVGSTVDVLDSSVVSVVVTVDVVEAGVVSVVVVDEVVVVACPASAATIAFQQTSTRSACADGSAHAAAFTSAGSRRPTLRR